MGAYLLRQIGTSAVDWRFRRHEQPGSGIDIAQPKPPLIPVPPVYRRISAYRAEHPRDRLALPDYMRFGEHRPALTRSMWLPYCRSTFCPPARANFEPHFFGPCCVPRHNISISHQSFTLTSAPQIRASRRARPRLLYQKLYRSFLPPPELDCPPANQYFFEGVSSS